MLTNILQFTRQTSPEKEPSAQNFSNAEIEIPYPKLWALENRNCVMVILSLLHPKKIPQAGSSTTNSSSHKV